MAQLVQAPLQGGQAGTAALEERHTVLGFWEYAAGHDPEAALVGRRLQSLRSATDGRQLLLQLEGGARFAAAARGGGAVGWARGRAPDEAGCCPEWCGRCGGPPPRIEAAHLLLALDHPELPLPVWEGGRRAGGTHVELGLKFEEDPAWYRLQGRELAVDGDGGEEVEREWGASPGEQGWAWSDVVLEALAEEGDEAGGWEGGPSNK